MKISSKFTSIRNKIIQIIVIVTSFSLFIAFILVITFDFFTFKTELINQTELIARVIGEYSIPDLEFEDYLESENTLQKLNNTTIDFAILFDKNNLFFSSYRKNKKKYNIPIVKKDKSYFSDNALHVFKTIKFKGKEYGTIYLRSSTQHLSQKILRHLLILFIIAIGVILFSFLIAYKFEKVISKPITDLTDATRKITQLEDFSIRVEKSGNDEIGVLCDDFNNMLIQIHEREVERDNAIIKLKKKQDELLNMRHYLQSVIDSMPTILIAVNSDSVIIDFNKEAAKFTEFDRTDIIGKHFSIVFTIFRNQIGLIENAIENGKTCKNEHVNNIFANKVFFTDIMVYPLLGKGVKGAVIRIDDVSERVKIEAMMVQTEKMMSVGGLAAGMAHEINNPLSGILMSAQNFLRRISPDLEKNHEVAKEIGTSLETIQEYLDQRGLTEMITDILNLGKRSSVIVKNMLSFSRRSESYKQSTNMIELIESTIELADKDYDLKKRYDFKHIKIIKEFGENLPEVECIATEIEQVILNLVKNSAHAMTENKTVDPKIIIRAKKDKGYIRIEVEDNGPGMDKETSTRVFEPFFTTKPPGVGTGLGLSVSYFIITNNHHGEIFLRSNEFQGSKFIIRIPFKSKNLN